MISCNHKGMLISATLIRCGKLWNSQTVTDWAKDCHEKGLRTISPPAAYVNLSCCSPSKPCISQLCNLLKKSFPAHQSCTDLFSKSPYAFYLTPTTLSSFQSAKLLFVGSHSRPIFPPSWYMMWTLRTAFEPCLREFVRCIAAARFADCVKTWE